MADVPWGLLWIQLTASRNKGNITGNPLIIPHVFFWNFSLEMVGFFLNGTFKKFSISKAKQRPDSEIRVSHIPLTCCHLQPENKDYAVNVKYHFRCVCKGRVLLRRNLPGESQREQKGRSPHWCKWVRKILIYSRWICGLILFSCWKGQRFKWWFKVAHVGSEVHQDVSTQRKVE